MITLDDLKQIGTFRKTHALQGELNASCDIDPSFIEEGYPIFVNLDGVFVPFYTESCRTKGQNSELVKLEDVDLDMANSSFVNQPFYALKSDIADFYDVDEEDLIDDEDIIDFKVITTKGDLLGIVEDIDDSTLNVYIKVKNPDDEELIIPFVDEFVVSISRENKTIEVDIPEDLLNLNSLKMDNEL